MAGVRAGGRRLLRLGLAAAAASIGAVALSLLVGGACASAIGDDSAGPLHAAESAVGNTVGLEAVPADAHEGGLVSVTPSAAPAAPTGLAVLAEAIPAAAAPAVHAAVAAPAAIAQSAPAAVSELQPVEAAQPVLEPLAPVTEHVASLGTRAVEVVAPALEPIAAAIDAAAAAAAIADDLLPDAPVPSPLPAAGAVPDEPRPAVAATDIESEAVDPSVVAASQERTAAAVPAPPPAVMAPPSADRVLHPPPSLGAGPGPQAFLPSGTGGGAPGGQPPAVTHAHFAPELTGGKTGAVEQDRVPASLVEELTTSPD